MTLTQGLLVWVPVVLAGVGPFIAVKRGGDVYKFPVKPEPRPECSDDTTQIPRVTDEADPYNY